MTIPTDLKKSIKQYEILIDTIEEYIYEDSDEILKQLTKTLKCKKRNIETIFNRHIKHNKKSSYGIFEYIKRRKLTEAIKLINNLGINKTISKSLEETVNREIAVMTGRSREQFRKSIKSRYNITIKDILNNNINYNLLDNKLDIREYEVCIEDSIQRLHKFSNHDLIDIKIVRSKVNLINMNINKIASIFLSMNYHVYYEVTDLEEHNREDYMYHMITNDKTIESWHKIKDNAEDIMIMLSKNSFGELVKDDNRELFEGIYFEIDFFKGHYKDRLPIRINGLNYFVANRYLLRGIINNFEIPKEINNYKTILSKTKVVLDQLLHKKILLEDDNYHILFINTKDKLNLRSIDDVEKNYYTSVKQIYDNLEGIERNIFITLVGCENKTMHMESIYDIYKRILELKENVSIREFDRAIRSLFIKGYLHLNQDFKYKNI